MKITDVTTLTLSRAHELECQWATASYRTVKADCAVVVVTTDEGLTGIGEACAYGVPPRIAEWVEWLKPTLVGHDPLGAAVAPHPNGRATSHHEWAFDCAAAGLDCALWDLRGKVAGLPVRDLLATTSLNRVRLYASSGCRYDWGQRPESLIEEVLGYLADGYMACKVRIGTEWAWDGVTTDRFIGLMTDLAGAVNRRLELMLDGNQRLTEQQALQIAHALDRLGFTWFEEPIPQSDIEGYVRLNAAVDLPITGGEQFTTLEQFRPYLERRAYGIVQPDVGWCGITEALKIAQMAARYGIDLCARTTGTTA